MASYEIDSVKVEKANALRRYNWQRNRRWVFEVFAALFVLSVSTPWVPVAVETARDYLRRFIAIFDSTLHVLLLVMIIILIIYAYSGERDATSDVYDEFTELNDSSRRFIPGEEPPTQEETFHDKHNFVNCSDNAVSLVHDEDSIVSLVNNPSVSQIQSEREIAAVSEKALRKDRYRRAISEKFEQRIEERSRLVLRRSATEICRKVVISGEEPSRRSWSYSVDNLSKDEFNRTVDAFIAEKKKILREECKEERINKESTLALTIQKY